MTKKHLRANRGAVLIVVLGVLVVLTLLATVFATTQAMERSIAKSYLDNVRSKLVAKAGVEEARQRLYSGMLSGTMLFPDDPLSRSWVYYANDVTELKNIRTTSRIPLRQALNPSFAIEREPEQNPSDFNFDPLLVTIDGKKQGISGYMGSGTYGRYADQYTTRVRDLQGLIHVNDGIRENAKFGSTTQNLVRILNNLGRIVGVAQLGTRIIAKRPQNGYQSNLQLLAAVDGNRAEFDLFKDFVTVRAWVDKNVANPVPLSREMLSHYPVKYFRGLGDGVYRRGRGVDYKGKPVSVPMMWTPVAPAGDHATMIWAVDELAPQWIEITERAPVNVNTAPREVLVALLGDLQGWFMLGRRRNNPKSDQIMYATMTSAITHSTERNLDNQSRTSREARDSGELGHLYATVPIVIPQGTTSNAAISAFSIADEIIACRNRTKSYFDPNFDYASASFGGAFRTWRQFEAFCDNLATLGILKDDRDIYYDYDPAASHLIGYGPLIKSAIQKKYAEEALADVLKSNFNPNLHLNEFNPDNNLFRRVDKTDLIVSSTEFCFTPMGYFEIESIGRVLLPKGSNNALTAVDNTVRAEKKVSTVVRMFDVHRETAQGEFLRGQMDPAPNNVVTSSSRALEIGPESNNGVAAQETLYAGYIALPTFGGIRTEGPVPVNSAARATPAGSPRRGEVIYVPFARDHDAHVHAAGMRRELASGQYNGEGCRNFPDPGETKPGPYNPVGGYRLARSFSMIGSNTSFPNLTPKANSDLRIDGAYIERHAGAGYMNGAQIMDPELIPNGGSGGGGNGGGMRPGGGARPGGGGARPGGGGPRGPVGYQEGGRPGGMGGRPGGRPGGGNGGGNNGTDPEGQGAASYWVKPWFDPELTGNVRKFLDISRFRSSGDWSHSNPMKKTWFDPVPFFQVWLAAHDTVPFARPNEFQNFLYQKVTKPSSVVFGYMWGGVLSGTMNHKTHQHQGGRFVDQMRAREWMHVAVEWKGTRRRIYMNGEMVADGRRDPNDRRGYGLNTVGYSAGHMDNRGSRVNVPWYQSPNGQFTTPIRLGHTSVQGGEPRPHTLRRNWTADSTMDEFYFYKGIPRNQGHLKDWFMGRYVKPVSYGATFVSGVIRIGWKPRNLAPPSSIQPTGKFGVPPGTHFPGAHEKVRVIGVAWTWAAEGADDTLGQKPFLYDYSGGVEFRRKIYPVVSVMLEAPNRSVRTPYLTNDGFSGTPDAIFSAKDGFHYRVNINLPSSASQSTILASPVVDDVSIYYALPEPEFVSYIVE